MIAVKNRPFLSYQLQLLKEHNISDVVLCVSHLAEQIKGYFKDGREIGVSIKYSVEEHPLGTAGAIKNAEPFLKDEFFVMNGDSYLMFDYPDVMRFFRTNDKLALMTVYENHNRYDISNVIVDGQLVKRYDRKRRLPEMVYVDAGLYVFRKGVLKFIPPGVPAVLDELFTRLVAQKQVLAYRVSQRFYEIGSPQGLEEFEHLVELKR
jgi:NDP-sugar pyrophosphorylase family protein